MDYVLLFFAYAAFVFVSVAYGIKAYKYANTPMALRWDLYPMPHEKAYGGSCLEEPKWYEKPRRGWGIKNWWFMIKDYLVMNQYFERNRAYWLTVYPYHLGFYGIFILDGIFFLQGFLALAGIHTGSTSGGFYYASLVFAGIAFILGPIGCIGMLLRRAIDKNLKYYASPKLYFNYLFFFVVFLSGLIAWAFFEPSLSGYRQVFEGMILFNPVLPGPATVVHIVLFLLFLFYLPYTRSLHYVTKFFAFFWVRWDDRRHVRGSAAENRLVEQLNFPVSWSASHIQQGRKWAEVAQGMPQTGER